MAGDTILDLMTRVDLGPLKAAMEDASASVSASTQKMSASYSTFAANAMAANEGVKSVISKLPPEFIKVEAGGIAAFEQIKRRVIEATSEVGALRQEILSTNDAGKLTQLNAQLEQARARMGAARTEMRAMRLEMTETREKADLLGDSMGVKIPTALGRMLGQMPLLQSVMNAAFAPIMVLYFAETVYRAIEGIANLSREMGGFGEAERKAFESALDFNQKLILVNLDLKEKLAAISVIGKEGAAKYAAETRVATDAAKAQAAELARVNREFDEMQEKVNRLTLKKKINTEDWLDPWNAVFNAIRHGTENTTEELEAAEKSLQRVSEERNDLNIKGLERPVKSGTAQAEEEARRAEEARAIQRAATDANKSLQNEYVNFYEQSLRRMYAAEKITLADEVTGEKEAILARLQIERDFAAQRKKELAAEGATGKNVGPQIEGVNTQLVEAELKTRSQIAAIDQRFDQETLEHRNAVNLATVQAAKSTADSEIAVVEETSRRRFANGQIVLDELTAIEKAAATQRIDGRRSELQEQLRIAGEFPIKNEALIVTLNAQLENLERQKVRDIDAINTEAENRKRQVLAIEAEAAKAHQQSLLEIERLGIETRATLGLLGGRQRLAQLQAITTQEYQLEREAIEKKKALYAVGTAQFEEAEKELQQISDKYNRQMAEDEAASLKARFAAWTKFDRQISDGFATAVGEMLRGEKTFGQALVGVWNSMVVDFAQMLTRRLTQWALQHTAMRLISQVFHLQEAAQQIAARTAQTTGDTAARTADVAQTAAANVAKTTSDAGYTAAHVAAAGIRTSADLASIGTALPATILANVGMVVSDAGVAGAAGFASVMEALPFPLNIATAPGVAATAIALTLSNLSLASAAGGMDVMHDQMALVHKNEMVLPASIAQNFRNSSNNSSSRSSGPTNHHWNITINGAKGDLGQQLDRELVPRIKRALRTGELDV